jgi:hypothetical protein
MNGTKPKLLDKILAFVSKALRYQEITFESYRTVQKYSSTNILI